MGPDLAFKMPVMIERRALPRGLAKQGANWKSNRH